MSTEESNFPNKLFLIKIECEKQSDDDFMNIVSDKTVVCFI